MAKSVNTKNTNQLVELTEDKWRPALSGWPMIFAWAAMIIFALHASTHMVGAGDTWVAMACGRHFINHGVDTVEPFSANSHHAGPTEQEIDNWPGPARWIAKKVGLKTVKYWHPTGWINQNWLTHVLFYWLSHESPFADAEERSFNTLVYWKFALYIVTVICVYYIGRLIGVNGALSAVFACFALFAGRSFFDIRPAGFSNLMVAVFFLILALAVYRNILYIWLLVPTVVLWCNLHGGYIYAFMMLATFFSLHLLIILSKRWTVFVHCIFMWMALYGLAYRFLSHRPFTPIPLGDDKVLILLVLLMAASLVIVAAKKVKNQVIYSYHILASVIVFLALLPRFFPEEPVRYTQELKEYILSSRLSFIIGFFALMALGMVVTFFKDRLICIRLKGLCHTAGAGFAAFIATIVFNPFHLTNLTHTFVISVSRHAEQWRTVNEWHPGFEWNNPVGTGFPFLVLVIMSIGVPVFWLVSRSFRPKLLKGSKTQLEQQQRFRTLSKIFGLSLAVFLCWTAFTSLSFLDLDVGSFFVCTLFIGIILLSIYKNVHFIYLELPLILLAMWAAGPKHGFSGRYIYPFVLLPTYVIVHVLASRFSEKLKFRPVNIASVAGTVVVSMILMIAIFNPFKFTLPLWHVEQLFGLTRKFLPRYEGKYRVNYRHLFIVLYIINIASVLCWLGIDYIRKLFAGVRQETARQGEPQVHELPKADLALMAAAALTVYMAYRSRRFIPIAAIIACPVLALLIQWMIRNISAAGSFYGLWSFGSAETAKHNRFTVGAMPRVLQLFIASVGAVIVVGLGAYWTVKFKTVYLDPWPTDPKLTSVFMRMTASDAKPFYALDFIRENKLKGNMFNYWTEGGFIAYGQDPDPNTGKTPLQLFMDGRAQAAYNRAAYDNWSNIMAGGVITYQLQKAAGLRGRDLNSQEYRQIANWIDEQLKKPENDVWAVLMPAGEFNKPFTKSFDYHPDWRLVFFNNKQKLFVDARTPQAKKLLEAIETGQAVYPNEFCRDLIMARRRLKFGRTSGQRTEGLDFAAAAFEQHQSAAAMQTIMSAARFPELRDRVVNICRNYFKELWDNQQSWAGRDGYHHKLAAGVMAGNYLRNVERARKKSDKAADYAARTTHLRKQTEKIIATKRW